VPQPLQDPASHVAPIGQVFPQPPQLLRSVWVFTQVPPQQACPGASHGTPPQVQVPFTQVSPAAQVTPPQPPLQVPATQVSPAAQAWPQDPQFAGSFEVSSHVETPFAVQQSYPPGHPANSQSVHFLFTQLPDGQTFPQSPQFAGSVEVSRHVPPQQSGSSSGQTLLHLPQLSESSLVLLHVPSQQVSPESAQLLVQSPQWALSWARSAHSPLQQVADGPQLGPRPQRQNPATQVSPAPGQLRSPSQLLR
jgi:hypothetical protein